jgi:hypothetical protein
VLDRSTPDDDAVALLPVSVVLRGLLTEPAALLWGTRKMVPMGLLQVIVHD